MKSMLEKVWDASWDEDEYEDLEDCVAQNIFNYKEMGELFTQLLEYHGGKYDDKAMALIVDMMGEYIDDNI